MGFGNFLKKVLNPLNPIKQAVNVNRRLLGSGKQLLQGNLGQAAKQAFGAGTAALNPFGASNPLGQRLQSGIDRNLGLNRPPTPSARPMPAAPGSGLVDAMPGGAPSGGGANLVQAAMPFNGPGTFSSPFIKPNYGGASAPAPAPAAPLMSYEEAKAKYGAQRAQEMQRAGQVGN